MQIVHHISRRRDRMYVCLRDDGQLHTAINYCCYLHLNGLAFSSYYSKYAGKYCLIDWIVDWWGFFTPRVFFFFLFEKLELRPHKISTERNLSWFMQAEPDWFYNITRYYIVLSTKVRMAPTIVIALEPASGLRSKVLRVLRVMYCVLSVSYTHLTLPTILLV